MYGSGEEQGRGGTLSKHEVQLGKRTGGKRGAPFGNRNRLIHGCYSAARAARHAKVMEMIRRTRALAARLVLFGCALRALAAKRGLAAERALAVLPARSHRDTAFAVPVLRCVSRRQSLARPALRCRAPPTNKASEGKTFRGLAQAPRVTPGSGFSRTGRIRPGSPRRSPRRSAARRRHSAPIHSPTTARSGHRPRSRG